MFLDAAALDTLYDETQGALHFGVFDRRVLVPLSDLPASVERETGVKLPATRLDRIIEEGWLPALTTADGELGFPLYAPGRIGLLLRLEADGVTQRELAAFAEYEEGIISSVLTADDTPYEDDDLAIVVRDAEEQVESLERRLAYATTTPPANWVPHSPQDIAVLERDLGAQRRSLEALRGYVWDRLRAETHARIRRHAFKLRAIHEQMRVMMCQTDRALVAQGYSFFIQWSGYHMDGLDYDAISFGQISWPETLKSPWLTGEADSLPIRLPGLLIDGDVVSMTRLVSPSEYETAWTRLDLEGFRRTQAARTGERLCQRCLAPLPPVSSLRRKFCSESCKSQAKAETYRRQHPDRVKASRHR